MMTPEERRAAEEWISLRMPGWELVQTTYCHINEQERLLRWFIKAWELRPIGEPVWVVLCDAVAETRAFLGD